MKVLFGIKGMHEARGGAERVLSDITAYLADRGYEVVLMSFDQPGSESFYPIDPRVRRICLGIGDTANKAKLGETLRRMSTMRRTIRKEQPEVVIGFMHSTFVPLAFSLIGTAVPIVASEHIVPLHYRDRKLEYVLLAVSALLVRRFTVLSQNIRCSYPWIVRRHMVPIPNPVRIPESKSKDHDANGSGGVILNVGRLDAQKDQETLINAFAAIARECPNWRLRIVGEGILRSHLEQQAIELDLSDRIELPGTTSDIDVEYQAADIFAVPSRYESFGLGTAEAMSHGLPAVGFADCPGTNELIEDGSNGILVDPADRVDNFAAALRKLVENPGLRRELGNRARDRVCQFAPEVVFTAWERLLEETSARPRV